MKQMQFATRAKLYKGTVSNHQLELPCDVRTIKHVCASKPQSWYGAFIDGSESTRLINYRVDQSGNLGAYNPDATSFDSIQDDSVTTYVINKEVFTKPLGRMIPYENVNNQCLHFNFESIDIDVLYESLMKDDSGYPMVPEKTLWGLAHYLQYIEIRKRFYMKESTGDQVQLAKTEMEQAVAQARTPEGLSQNEIDDILNVLTSFNRKRHNMQHRE
jgi:hypothetical protein